MLQFAHESGCAYGRTQHMLVSVWGKRWREVKLAFFTMYLDDSGTSPSQQVAVASAIIVPAVQLPRMEIEWNNLKAKEGFSEWHTSECLAANRNSEFATWDEEKRGRAFRRVREISKKYGAASISAAIKKADYDEIMPPEYRKYTGVHHYSWRVTFVIAMAEIIMASGLKEKRLEPFEFVFDWMDAGTEKRREIEDVMAYSERACKEEQGFVGAYSNYSFRHRREFPGLQCVDAIGWTTYRYALTVNARPIPEPKFARTAWEHYGGQLGPNGWLRAFHFAKNTLHDWVMRDRADGRMMRRFARWEAEDAAKGSKKNSLSASVN